MKKLLLLLLLMVCNTLSAQSLDQAKVGVKQKIAKDQPGSEKAPIFIKKLATEEEKIAGDKEEAERKKKLEMDIETLQVAKDARDAARDAAKYAWLGLLIALAAAVIAFFQYKMFGRQLNAMDLTEKRAANESEQRTKETAAALSVNATAARTAHAAFMAANRPKLIIRAIDTREKIIKGSQALIVEYEIVNLGNTNATINKISHKLWIPGTEENLPPKPPYAPTEAVDLNVAPGYSGYDLKVSGDAANEFFFSQGFAEASQNASNDHLIHTQYFLLGFIEYTDEPGRIRRTGFLRQLDLKTGRFTAMTHPDYEYQD